MGDFGGGRDVGDVEQRVGRGLDPHILVVLGGQCGFHGFQIGDVHHVEAHTPRHEHLGEQAVGAAVHIVAEQDVVAGLDGGAQQHVDGGQARGEAQRVLAAFHGGELLVEAGASGVDGATTAPVVGSGSWPAWMARVAMSVLANLALYSADMILGSFRDRSVFEGKTGAVS